MNGNGIGVPALQSGMALMVSAMVQTLAAQSSISDPPSQAPLPGPRIRIATPTFDFGKAKEGEVLDHSFAFANTGTTRLEIKDVRPGCGCTTVGIWDKHIEPGGTGRIPVQLNTTGFSGVISKNLQVTSNDPAQPLTLLCIKARISKSVEISPAIVLLNLVEDATNREPKIVRLVNTLDDPLTPSEPVCSDKRFRAVLRVIRPGKEFEVIVSAVPPVTVGSLRTTVVLKTNHPDVPAITFNVFAVVQPALVVIPARITLPPGPLTSPVRTIVTIRNNSTDDISITNPTTNLQDIEVDVQPGKPGRQHHVVINFPTGFRLQPNQRAQLTVRSDHPRYPIITVPVCQWNDPAETPAQAIKQTPPTTPRITPPTIRKQSPVPQVPFKPNDFPANHAPPTTATNPKIHSG